MPSEPLLESNLFWILFSPHCPQPQGINTVDLGQDQNAISLSTTKQISEVKLLHAGRFYLWARIAAGNLQFQIYIYTHMYTYIYMSIQMGLLI